MAFRETFGRCLVVINCILAGISKFTDPMPAAKDLSDSYSKIYAKSKEFGFKIPMAPHVISTASVELIYLTGFLLLLGGILTIFKSRIGILLLISLLLSFNFVIHNPAIYTKEKDLLLHTESIILNFAQIAGLILCWPTSRKNKEKAE